MQVTTIGLDLAKHWFQVHGVDANGRIAVRRKLRRSEVLDFFQSLPLCLVGMEACATAHHWARELTRLGHTVKLMPPAYVKAYVKRNKNDAADAEAICEAVGRPSMRFVPVKDADQQSVLMLHRVRNLLVRQRTMLVNALRAHMAEFGIVAPQGLRNVEMLTKMVAHEQERLPELARSILQLIVDQLHDTMARVRVIEVRLAKWHQQSICSQLLATVPGVGIMGASAIAATVADPSLFRSIVVPIRPRVCCLVGDDAAAELQWRQGTVGAHQQARRQIHPQPAHRRRGRRAAPCTQSTDTRRRVGPRYVGTQADQGRGGRAGQQDRSHRVGGDDARGWLSRQTDSRAAGIAAAGTHSMRG
jgi:transposase